MHEREKIGLDSALGQVPPRPLFRVSAYLRILLDTLPLHVHSLLLLIIASVKEVAVSPVRICWSVCLFASRITGNQINRFLSNLAERPRAKAKRDPQESLVAVLREWRDFFEFSFSFFFFFFSCLK